MKGDANVVALITALATEDDEVSDSIDCIGDHDYGREAHVAASRHLEACINALDAYESESEELPDDPSIAPFDGCTDCIVREVLSAAWPIWERLVEDSSSGN